MCGIVGYVGTSQASPFLVEGLRRLEYRGYDSSGLAIHTGQSLGVTRSVGRIDALAGRLDETPRSGSVGIGHTRWATHGSATEPNAHPHLGGDGEVVLVHNGVIENFRALRSQVVEKGYSFRSETDSGVIAHLLAEKLKNSPEVAGKPDVRYL
ncbi:MAG: glutamine--fructose-6-phosphate aminotransferase, partial [Planctomycetaceae bacterium]|nr:glutamine--fructose-6-phosphate aminotransferase [Planctomycetaceae bacterium]